MTLKELQATIEARWGSASYIVGVNHQNHAALHLMKALGKVSTSLEQTEHIGGDAVDVSPQIADLVICSARLAELLGFDLEDAVAKRIADKFPAGTRS